MLEEIKSLYPSLAYRLFHNGTFDTAQYRNLPISIIVVSMGPDYEETQTHYTFGSVIDIPFDLLQMSCYKEPDNSNDSYYLCGMPAGIDGQFVVRYKEDDSPITIRSLFNDSTLFTIGIIVDLNGEDDMTVMYPAEDYQTVRLPRNVFGTEYEGYSYFHNIDELISSIARRNK